MLTYIYTKVYCTFSGLLWFDDLRSTFIISGFVGFGKNSCVLGFLIWGAVDFIYFDLGYVDRNGGLHGVLWFQNRLQRVRK